MARYVKNPIEIEAYKTDKEMIIHTLEGDMKANIGDYIITGIKGEQYPCKPDISEATYEISTIDVVPKSDFDKLKDDNKFLQDRRFKELSEVRAEVAREIFEEIESMGINGIIYTFSSNFAELKKKYDRCGNIIENTHPDLIRALFI